MGKAVDRPLYSLFGGALRQRVPAYVTGFYYKDGEREDDLKREAALYMGQGYRTVKVKVGGLTPEADAVRVGLIRKAVGNDVVIMLDANQGWNLSTAVRAARLCEPYNIFWLEDPMPWYDERHTLRRLKEAVSIPIAAGETEYSPFGIRTLVAEGLVDYLIIDSTWAGGLTTWRKAAAVAELYQVPMAAHHDPQIHVHAVAASPTGFILESFADPARDPLWFELFRERPRLVQEVARQFEFKSLQQAVDDVCDYRLRLGPFVASAFTLLPFVGFVLARNPNGFRLIALPGRVGARGRAVAGGRAAKDEIFSVRRDSVPFRL